MTDAAREQARMLAEWLETLDADEERIAVAMGEISENHWKAVTDLLPAPFEADSINRVITRAHELLGRAPNDAQRLARLALRMTAQINHATCPDAPLIEGDAWRECAAAHLEMAEYADAYEAVCAARKCYSQSESARVNGAILLLVEGRTLFELGRWDEALAAVEHASHELLDSGADRKKYVQAKTIHAIILVGIGQYDAALDVFSTAADLAMQAGDKETLAYILSNAGVCAANLEDPARAKRCLESALRYFEELGLTSEMPHARAALVTILKQQGRYNEAVSELFKVRAEFLSLRVPTAAAITSLRIVEVLLLCGRTAEVPVLCDEMVRTFSAARLQKNLLTALAYLNEVARQRQLAAADVAYVAAFIEHSENAPEHLFTVPEWRKAKDAARPWPSSAYGFGQPRSF
jgi:tetratricopeptide (TPR) repeat protein